MIEPSGLSEEAKAALWLYGWTCLEQGRTEYQERQDRIRRRAGRSGELSGGD